MLDRVSQGNKELNKLSTKHKMLENCGQPLEPGDEDDEIHDPELKKLKKELDKVRDVALQHDEVLQESLIQQARIDISNIHLC